MAVFHVSKEVLEIILWNAVRTIPQLIPVIMVITTILVATSILTIPIISYHHFRLLIRIPIVTVTAITTIKTVFNQFSKLLQV